MNYYNQALPSLSMGEALKLATSRLTQFSGRSRRSEYWWTVLVAFLASLVLVLIPFANILICLAMLPLTLRRLHDTGRSAMWLLPLPVFYVAIIIAYVVEIKGFVGFQHDVYYIYIGFCCLVYLAYSIMLLVFTCQDSQPYTNRYGESPKYQQRQAN
ncbi:MAG: DUF805 domain-containing protein [Prevotella sp.]|nr:DUF805 domain-containing protein [Prevotella sp.]